MKFNLVSVAVCGIISGIASTAALAESKKADDFYFKDDRIQIQGFVAHGINTYNGNKIGDYSVDIPNLLPLSILPSVREIGAFAEGEGDASEITADTSRSLPVATTRSFFDFANGTNTINEDLVNVPLTAVNTNEFGGSGVESRVDIVDFDDAANGPAVYRSSTTYQTAPTVGEWEQISGKMSIAVNDDGSSSIQVTVKNALPNTVYTLWEVGARNPQSDTPSMFAVPLGGVPNVVVTNTRGCATTKVELPYSIMRECSEDAATCTAYISLFGHWDGAAYGGSPAMTGANPPVPTGVYGANHMVWPINGELLQEPPTTFPGRFHHCGYL